ncbi:MAG: glycosyltransferase family 4 protein [candidate division WOR-3 bacterium]|nr:MAG: glycosyltransferase family 4 protein [candidate division WOR-3 bacterium]
MKIAIHAIYYHPEVGGMESHIKDLAEEFIERGHEVHIVCGRSLPGLPSQETIDSVRVTRTRWFGRHPMGWVLYVLGSMRTFLRVAEGADVVHGQGFPCALATRVAKKRHGAVNLVTIHSSHFLKLAPKKALGPLFRYMFEAADHMLAPSSQLAEAIRSVSPGRQVECYVNSVNTRVFRKVEPSLNQPGRAIVVCPRRLVEKNGVRFAVRALPLILRHAPAHLYMVGPGPLHQELQSLARELGVAESITFLGRVPHGQMPGILSSADVILIPSLMEATSIAALESMACERVIAASNVGGIPEIVDQDVGVLFEPGNVEEIAAKVRQLLAMDRETMGRTARQRVVDKWSAARLADRHLEIYQRLVARSASCCGGD